MLIALAAESQFRSGIFNFAISSICFIVTFATFVRLDSFEPFSTFAAFKSNTAAGGVLVIKVNDLSEYTVITTGMIIPGWLDVRALNCLQKSMMLMPFGPS